jgi:RNA polymerase sigma-70 factor (ECF subfamily)
LKQLQEPYRTTVVLRDIEEMSYEQIAEVMEISLGTVKSRLVRGRDALRRRLERHMPAFGVSCEGRQRKRRKEEGPLGTQGVEVMP